MDHIIRLTSYIREKRLEQQFSTRASVSSLLYSIPSDSDGASHIISEDVTYEYVFKIEIIINFSSSSRVKSPDHYLLCASHGFYLLSRSLLNNCKGTFSDGESR
jgi:hypothetical protein